MNIIKNRRIKFISLLTLCCILLMILYIHKFKKYPCFEFRDEIKIGSLNGNVFLLNNKISKLNINDRINLVENFNIKLENKSSMIIWFNNSKFRWSINGPALISKIILYNKFSEIKKFEYNNYMDNKKLYFTSINYSIIIIMILIFWIILIYLKNGQLYLSFYFIFLSVFLSFIIYYIFKNIINFSFNSLYLLISNFIIIFILWIIYPKKNVLPEQINQNLKITDMIFDGYKYFEDKNHLKALNIFKKVLKIAPERHDIKKIIDLLNLTLSDHKK